MTRIQLSIRIPSTQDTLFKRYAEARGISKYEAVVRAVEAGLGLLTDPQARDESAAILEELASLSARLGWSELLIERCLFVAANDFAYARHAALRGERDPQSTDRTISAAAEAAYHRQKAYAKGQLK